LQDLTPDVFRHRLAEKTLEEIRKATNKAWVLGNDHFQQRVEKLTERQTSPKPRGGDRKSKAYQRISLSRWFVARTYSLHRFSIDHKIDRDWPYWYSVTERLQNVMACTLPLWAGLFEGKCNSARTDPQDSQDSTRTDPQDSTLLRSAIRVNEQFPERDFNPLDTLPMTACEVTPLFPANCFTSFFRYEKLSTTLRI